MENKLFHKSTLPYYDLQSITQHKAISLKKLQNPPKLN